MRRIYLISRTRKNTTKTIMERLMTFLKLWDRNLNSNFKIRLGLISPKENWGA